MKTFATLALGAALLAGFGHASAEENLLKSRSVGKLKSDQTRDLSLELQQQEAIVREKSATDENYANSPMVARNAGVANRYDQVFEVYQADVQLLDDFDGDHYYHSFNVVFDVDVSYDAATVYAKIYVSREGEPWSQVYTTDLFHIYGEEVEDTYEVGTELLEGYEPGHYAILIEIYSLDHAYMVASEVLDYHYLGREVLLEDLYWDEPPVAAHGHVEVEVYDHGHGGGSMATLLLFFLIIQVVIAARGALALIPRKKSEN